MKKKLLYSLITITLIFIIIIIGIFKNIKEDNNIIKVSEVTHSVFYTPFYVAIENGYFKENDIEIDLYLVSGSDNVAASVLSNDTEVGLAGPESAIFVYNGGEKDYLEVFSGLTKRDGQFIISRNKEEFKWTNLINKEILVGRSTGMPALSFKQALKNQNIDENQVNVNYSIDFAELSGTFIGGTGDYVNLFEPTASNMEKNNQGYVMVPVGLYSNEFPYTAFYARKSYIKNNKDILIKFNDAIKKGMDFVNNNDSKTIANVIKPQFNDTNIKDLESIIERYKKADVWLDNTIIEKDFFNNIVNLLTDNNIIKNNKDYYKIVNNIKN